MQYILVNSSTSRMPRQFIIHWLQECVGLLRREKILDKKSKELTIVFMGVRQAKKVNFTFRQKNYATDVLSFEGDDQNILGELIICPEVVLRQAREHRLSFREELGYMILHGVLHLLGFDHEKSETEAKRMFALQDRIFDKLCRKFWK